MTGVYDVAESVATGLDNLFDDENGVFYGAGVAGGSSTEAVIDVATRDAVTDEGRRFIVIVRSLDEGDE